MDTSYFDEEITLSPAFKLWDRGDGIGEISLFNTIIGFVHGDNKLSDGYHYDESLEQYVEDTEIEYVPVSCFPGHLSSGHILLQPFSNTYIDCIEHLISLVQSLPAELLPEKPKGSLTDVFSGQEKFLISRDFDIDVMRYGKEIDKIIVDNFYDFSHYIKNYLQQFPEVNITFLNHSYVNGNIYVQYQLNNYVLSVLFDTNNTILFGKINKSGKFNKFDALSCNHNSYQTICDNIFSTLGLSQEIVQANICLSEQFVAKIPQQKNLFFNEILHDHTESFLLALYNRGKFLLERDLNILQQSDIKVNFNRKDVLLLQDKLANYDIGVIEGLSLFMNYFFHSTQNID